MPTAWYFKSGEMISGPISSQELKEKAASGVVRPETLVRRNPGDPWVVAKKVSGLVFGDAASKPQKSAAAYEKPKSPARTSEFNPDDMMSDWAVDQSTPTTRVTNAGNQREIDTMSSQLRDKDSVTHAPHVDRESTKKPADLTAKKSPAKRLLTLARLTVILVFAAIASFVTAFLMYSHNSSIVLKFQELEASLESARLDMEAASEDFGTALDRSKEMSAINSAATTNAKSAQAYRELGTKIVVEKGENFKFGAVEFFSAIGLGVICLISSLACIITITAKNATEK